MNHRRLLHSVIVAFIACAVSAGVVHAASAPDIGIAPGGVRFSPTPVLVGKEVKIYVTVRNNTADDTRGLVSFLDNDAEIGIAPISLRGGGVEEEVWYLWKPDAGQHNITAIAHLESGVEANTRDNRVDTTIFVDRDNDSDGLPDRDDLDDDNDGMPDAAEVLHGFDPLDSRDATGDADGDGITNKDELARGLNPRSKDTVSPPPSPNVKASSPPASPVVQPKETLSTKTLPAAESPAPVVLSEVVTAPLVQQTPTQAELSRWERLWSSGSGTVRSIKTTTAAFSGGLVEGNKEGISRMERLLVMGAGIALVIIGLVFWLSRSRRIDETEWDDDE